jgi:hypothetical protein
MDKKQIIKNNIAVVLGVLLLTLTLPFSVAYAHGGGPDEYNPSTTNENTTPAQSVEGNKNFLPYAIGGSVLIVGVVAGVAVWQRRKNS